MFEHVAPEAADQLQIDRELEALEVAGKVRVDLPGGVVERAGARRTRGLTATASSASTASKSSSENATRTRPAGEAARSSSPIRVSTVR